MSLESLRVYAESALQSAMATAYPGVSVRYENARFHQPETAFVDFCLLDGKSFAANMGTRKVDRHVGVAQIDVMVPERSGTSQGNQIAEFAGKVFREQSAGLSDGARVIFRTPAFTYVGRQGGFYRIMVRVPYWRDEAPQ